MTTLYIVRDCPYPPRSGSPLRSWQNINVLAKHGPVHLFSIGHREGDATHVPIVASWVHVDAADYEVGPRQFASRALRLLRSRQFPLNDATATPAMNDRLERAIKDLRPDLIVLSHWHNALPDALQRRLNVVVDAHNIESILGTGVRDERGRASSVPQRLKLWRWQQRERALFRGASRVWVPSDVDAAKLQTLDRRLASPVVWPNTLDLEYYRPVRERSIAMPSDLQPNGATIVFVGFYSYKPNAKAAMTLLTEVFPNVAYRIPYARLLLVGRGPTSEMLAAAALDDRVTVTGEVEDVRPYLAAADVSVVALTEGGGTRVKILEAFAAKVAVVSSSKAIEGVAAEHGKEVLISDDPSVMAEYATALLEDSHKRLALTALAFKRVRAMYSWESLEQWLIPALPAATRTALSRN